MLLVVPLVTKAYIPMWKLVSAGAPWKDATNLKAIKFRRNIQKKSTLLCQFLFLRMKSKTNQPMCCLKRKPSGKRQCQLKRQDKMLQYSANTTQSMQCSRYSQYQLIQTTPAYKCNNYNPRCGNKFISNSKNTIYKKAISTISDFFVVPYLSVVGVINADYRYPNDNKEMRCIVVCCS